ncbi:hypothetical protein [Pedococcus soli]
MEERATYGLVDEDPIRTTRIPYSDIEKVLARSAMIISNLEDQLGQVLRPSNPEGPGYNSERVEKAAINGDFSPLVATLNGYLIVIEDHNRRLSRILERLDT